MAVSQNSVALNQLFTLRFREFGEDKEILVKLVSETLRITEDEAMIRLNRAHKTIWFNCDYERPHEPLSRSSEPSQLSRFLQQRRRGFFSASSNPFR